MNTNVSKPMTICRRAARSVSVFNKTSQRQEVAGCVWTLLHGRRLDVGGVSHVGTFHRGASETSVRVHALLLFAAVVRLQSALVRV